MINYSITLLVAPLSNDLLEGKQALNEKATVCPPVSLVLTSILVSHVDSWAEL